MHTVRKNKKSVRIMLFTVVLLLIACVVGTGLNDARTDSGGEVQTISAASDDFDVFIEPDDRQIGSGRNIDPNKPMVALTFDDGPCGEYSPRILDCLEENGAAATFFEIGCNVVKYPDITRRAVELGCEIGAHGYYHKPFTEQSADDVAEDIRLCNEAFEGAIGFEPELIRPPQGSVVRSILDAYDQIFVGWSIDTEDWRHRNVEKTVSAVKQCDDLDGQVILMHSNYEESAQAAEQIIPWLLEQGYQLVTVSELFEYHYGITPESHYYYSYDYFISDGKAKLG